jgi:2-oxoglutarate dehydrogenase E2 component (dihydrolipoamide succinyltransferase)
MATEIRVPALGESVTEAIVGKWFKKAGDAVKADEPLVELETDKVTLEVNAPSAGVISEIRVKEGDTVAVGAVLGAIGEGAGAAASSARAGMGTGTSGSLQSSTYKSAG